MKKRILALIFTSFIFCGNVAYANPFQETIYYNDKYVKVINEHNRTEILLDTTNCTKHQYADFIEYTGKVHFVDSSRDVTIRFFHGQEDDWALIKYDGENTFKQLRVDDPLLVNLYYFLVDFAKEV